MVPMRTILGTVVMGMALAGTALAQAPGSVKAAAEMIDLQRKPVGRVTFEQTVNGVLISVALEGLPPGWHGFHIHETATCDPPFASAGGHFNPAKEAHGYRTEGLHAGDLPNVFIGPDGKGQAEMVDDRVALATDRPTDSSFLNRAIGAVQDAAGAKAYNLLADRGTAVVVHGRADDYASNPAGNAGDRIACGIVKLQ